MQSGPAVASGVTKLGVPPCVCGLPHAKFKQAGVGWIGDCCVPTVDALLDEGATAAEILAELAA